jgi:hypothetical protein
MKPLNSQNLLIASLLGLSTLFAGSYPLVKAQSAKNVLFEICLTVENWNRPSARDQIAKQKTDPSHFGSSFTGWTSDLEFFSDYYGALGGYEKIVLHGIWSLPKKDLDRKHECSNKWAEIGFANPSGPYEGNPKSEFWLFKHRMKSIVWTGKEYIITVEPKGRGFQLGYFNKQSDAHRVPVKVVNTKGQLLSRCDASWGNCKFSKPK